MKLKRRWSKSGMTVQRQAILRFIKAYQKEHGFSPSIREIGRAVGLSSTSSVARQLDVLEQTGRIVRGPVGSPRALAVRRAK